VGKKKNVSSLGGETPPVNDEAKKPSNPSVMFKMRGQWKSGGGGEKRTPEEKCGKQHRPKPNPPTRQMKEHNRRGT